MEECLEKLQSIHASVEPYLDSGGGPFEGKVQC